MGLKPLNFAVKLATYRLMKSLSISELAQTSGLTTDQMEKLLEGKHEPRAGTILKVMKAHQIWFEPEDFERII